MANDIDVILEVILGFFVGLTLLLVLLVRLVRSLDQTKPPSSRTPERGGRDHEAVG